MQTPSDNRKLCMGWVENTLKEVGGSAHRREVINSIWDNHESEIRSNGFRHSWQDDVAWAAWFLRQEETTVPNDKNLRGIWSLC